MKRWLAASSALLLAGRPAAAGMERVEPAALAAFRSSPAARVPLLVRWTGPAELPRPLAGETRQETRRRVVAALRERAGRAISICDRLERAQAGLQAQSLWIVNATALSADRSTLLALAHHPSVRAVLAPRPLHLMRAISPLASLAPLLMAPFDASEEPPPPWEIDRLGLPDLWAKGISGQGTVIATIDTGVDPTHPCLQSRYRGDSAGKDDRSWLDVVLGHAAPYDDLGHGTEVASAVLGDAGPGHRIGVAPGARWIAVKAADASGDLDLVNVLRAMQWLLAPTDRAGENPEPDLAPDVVSNSWGDYPGADETLRDAVRAWVAGGIVPVFAAGNNGIGGMGSPASYPEAIAVGASDENDGVALFSSRGPSPIDGGVKPDLVAPGVRISVAVPGDGYYLNTGTSFSAPLVAGVAALLLQVDPRLTPAALAGVLRATAAPISAPRPNNDTGWGRVDPRAAVLAAQASQSGR